jgi:hypothetical protein
MKLEKVVIAFNPGYNANENRIRYLVNEEFPQAEVDIFFDAVDGESTHHADHDCECEIDLLFAEEEGIEDGSLYYNVIAYDIANIIWLVDKGG